MTRLEIDTLESVHLGGITQSIRVRAADATNPVLLLMQQGPGLPIINEVPAFAELGLEQHFTVVYWDQRGTGLSAQPLRWSNRCAPFAGSAFRRPRCYPNSLAPIWSRPCRACRFRS
jgi:pimeloyl-ACP methyl ester carboxylesterase